MSEFTYLKNLKESLFGEKRMVFKNKNSVQEGPEIDKEEGPEIDKEEGPEIDKEEGPEIDKKPEKLTQEEIKEAVEALKAGTTKKENIVNELTDSLTKEDPEDPFEKNKAAIQNIIKTIPKYKKGFWQKFILPAMENLGITETEIRAFQEAKGLTVDGKPGPQTLNALAEMLGLNEKVEYVGEDENVDENSFYAALKLQPSTKKEESTQDTKEIA